MGISKTGSELADGFWGALAPAVQALVERPLVAARLDAAWAAREQTAFDLPARVFGAYLADRVTSLAELDTVLDPVAFEELFLACGCARGEVRAIAQLEARYFPVVARSLGRLRLAPHAVDEVLQRVRASLLVAPEGGAPGITGFSGRGALASWMSVNAGRTAYKLLQQGNREAYDPEEELARRTAPDESAERQVAKRYSSEAFKRAFVEALSQLSSREKSLLRLHYLDGVTIEQLGGMYQTHRATCARWLASARQRLLDGTRAALGRQLRIPLADCDSIIQTAQSGLEMTFHRLFAGAAQAAL